jgi:hypothetical protein
MARWGAGETQVLADGHAETRPDGRTLIQINDRTSSFREDLLRDAR